MSDEEQAGIRRAIEKWNLENQTNGSGVSFHEVINPGQIPAALNFQNGVNPVTNPDGTTGYATGLTQKEPDADGNIGSATITIDPTARAGVDPTPGSLGLDTIFEKVALHEIGHTMGLGHVAQSDQVAGRTVMNTGAGINDRLNNISTDLQGNPCDHNAVSTGPNFAPSPSPTPTPPECGIEGDSCSGASCCWGYVCGEISGTCIPCQVNPQDHSSCMSESCMNFYNMGGVYCSEGGGNCWTPILLDIEGDGFDLTDPVHGVNFDDGSGTIIRTAWTSARSDDAMAGT